MTNEYHSQTKTRFFIHLYKFETGYFGNSIKCTNPKSTDKYFSIKSTKFFCYVQIMLIIL